MNGGTKAMAVWYETKYKLQWKGTQNENQSRSCCFSRVNRKEPRDELGAGLPRDPALLALLGLHFGDSNKPMKLLVYRHGVF
jgi:hypothetical protein